MEHTRVNYFKIVSVILFYWTTSISMTFANKYLVGNRFSDIKNDISLFVAWAQCFITILLVLFIYLMKKYLFRYKDLNLPSMNASVTLNGDLVLMVISYSSMLALNNITLKYVGISFFQIARSLTLVFTLILSKLFLKKPVTLTSVGCCFIVIFGFVLGIDQEHFSGALSIKGVIYGIMSSFCIASTGILMKRAMDNLHIDSYDMVFYMNFGASVLYFPILIFYEQFQIVFVYKFHDNIFKIALLLTGVLGLLINFASNLEINVTSPTTHQISNNAKSVLQTLLAVIYFVEIKTVLWWVSNLIIVSGAICYTISKYFENKPI